jgi:hypothetical protein
VKAIHMADAIQIEKEAMSELLPISGVIGVLTRIVVHVRTDVQYDSDELLEVIYAAERRLIGKFPKVNFDFTVRKAQ